ncbi:Putative NADH-flavin reductase [Sediminibacterium ginsengisoli]|uniref:Putative NADH-flavin reductase n=2 Tax=Sediminibacterium ginsengisoli TaxID=413434 RepID=A0A1T4NWA7_9BACT|nr:Putative NADH-flavin reductase [Sediminibacterium ginsengisoli]
MTITIFGATGHVGKHLVQQALGKGYFVKAFGRNIDNLIDKDLRSDQFTAIKGYVFEEKDVLKALEGSDAVISVLGGSFDGKDKTRSLGLKNILTQMDHAGLKRIVALGGMGILDDESGNLLIDNPDYPQEYLPVGMEHLQAFRFLQASDADWTFVCSPDILNGDKTGKYITSTDHLPSPNHSQINAGDLADFMLQELTANHYLKKRVGISRL